MVVSKYQASSTDLRNVGSAFGAGSVAITSRPLARYWAAQLAPIRPVPTIATVRISVSATSFSPQEFSATRPVSSKKVGNAFAVNLIFHKSQSVNHPGLEKM